jgi:hypothetical protein
MLVQSWHGGLQVSSTFGGGQATSTSGTSLTTGGTAHTLGASFVELFASTTHDTHWVTLGALATAANNTRTDALLNIYKGANGSEVLLIENFPAGWSGTFDTNDWRFLRIPLFIPAGTRITAKAQALQTSKTVRVHMELEGWGRAPSWTGRGVEILGAAPSSSIGTSVTPGTASEGSFTAIGTTTYEWGFIAPLIQGTLSDTTSSNNNMAVDVGVGGSLYRGLENFMLGNVSNETGIMYSPGAFCRIPAGTALQLRAQAGTDATPADMMILGVY